MSDQDGTPVRIRHFTDPGCPFAFSAERQRLRLEWLYGDQLRWSTHMVVLREESSPEWPLIVSRPGPPFVVTSIEPGIGPRPGGG